MNDEIKNAAGRRQIFTTTKTSLINFSILSKIFHKRTLSTNSPYPSLAEVEFTGAIKISVVKKSANLKIMTRDTRECKFQLSTVFINR